MSFCSVIRCQSISFGKKSDLRGKEGHDRICIVAQGLLASPEQPKHPKQIIYERYKRFSKWAIGNTAH